MAPRPAITCGRCWWQRLTCKPFVHGNAFLQPCDSRPDLTLSVNDGDRPRTLSGGFTNDKSCRLMQSYD